MLAKVAAEADPTDAGVGVVQAFDELPGAVGGAVVDEDQLETALAERLEDAAAELLDRGLLVVEGDDDREVGRGVLQWEDVGRLQGGKSTRLRRAAAQRRCPPVPVAEEGHQARHEQRAHEGRVEEDGDPGADGQLLDEDDP